MSSIIHHKGANHDDMYVARLSALKNVEYSPDINAMPRTERNWWNILVQYSPRLVRSGRIVQTPIQQNCIKERGGCWHSSIFYFISYFLSVFWGAISCWSLLSSFKTNWERIRLFAVRLRHLMGSTSKLGHQKVGKHHYLIIFPRKPNFRILHYWLF